MKTKSKTNAQELNESHVWKGESNGFRFEIVHWGINDGPESFTRGKGHWNYYVYIREAQTARFQKLWLDGEIKKWDGSEREHLSYDYGSLPIIHDVDFHGGVTFYEVGNDRLKGQRYIKVGCDYGHWDDMQMGFNTNLQSVLGDAQYTCELLSQQLTKSPQ